METASPLTPVSRCAFPKRNTYTPDLKHLMFYHTESHIFAFASTSGDTTTVWFTRGPCSPLCRFWRYVPNPSLCAVHWSNSLNCATCRGVQQPTPTPSSRRYCHHPGRTTSSCPHTSTLPPSPRALSPPLPAPACGRA